MSTTTRVAAADEGARATVTSEVSPRPTHDLPVLEAFRGIAALMVVFTHVGFLSGRAVAGPWAGWLSRLDFGVTLFFLLSGFLLFRPFVQAAYGRRPAVPVRPYLRRRFLRIYPAFLIVLVANYLITPTSREFNAERWISTALLIQNYTGNFGNQLPGLVQTWSLAIEMSFYLALPLLAWLVLGSGTAAGQASERLDAGRAPAVEITPAQRRLAELSRRRQPLRLQIVSSRPWPLEFAAMRPGFVLLAVVLLSTVWRLFYAQSNGGIGNQNIWLPSFLDWFAAGMALAWLRERSQPIPALLRTLAATPGTCWSLALAGYWLTTTALAGPTDLTSPTIAEATLKHVTFLVIAVLALLPAVFGQSSTGWRRIAEHPFFHWLGQISFGVFLWHLMLLGAIRRILGMPAFDGHFLLSLLLTLAASAVAGTLSWRLLEEPTQRRWRTSSRTRARSAVVAPTPVR